MSTDVGDSGGVDEVIRVAGVIPRVWGRPVGVPEVAGSDVLPMSVLLGGAFSLLLVGGFRWGGDGDGDGDGAGVVGDGDGRWIQYGEVSRENAANCQGEVNGA